MASELEVPQPIYVASSAQRQADDVSERIYILECFELVRTSKCNKIRSGVRKYKAN